MTTPDMTTVETYNADITLNAERYAASLFLGRGKYANAEASTLEAIKEAADKLIAENPNATAKPIIVAFDANGNQATIGGKPAKAAKKAPAKKAAKPAKAAKAAKAPKEKPAKADKPAKAPKAAKAPKEKPLSARAQAEADAASGILPAAPDFSAETHKPYRKKLEALVALVDAGDIKGLKAFAINPISTSPKAMDRYRNRAVIALEASRKAAKKEAAATASA